MMGEWMMNGPLSEPIKCVEDMAGHFQAELLHLLPAWKEKFKADPESLPALVNRCLAPTEGFLRPIAMKFGFHMPTYRQQDFLGQSGWFPSRSTTNDLMNSAVDCVDHFSLVVNTSAFRNR